MAKTVRLRKEAYESAKEFAELSGKTLSELTSEAVEEYVQYKGKLDEITKNIDWQAKQMLKKEWR